MSQTVAAGRRRPTPPGRYAAYGVAILLTAFMLFPIYLIAVAAFSTRASVFDYPKTPWPTTISLDSIAFFLTTHDILPALGRSLVVALLTVALSLLLGCPAGYAIARYTFPGRNVVQLLLVNVRAFPVIILAIPLAVTFIQWNLYDTIYSVALVHSATALPFTVLLSASVFLRVPVELEEAAISLGTSRLGAVIRVVLPMSLPGLAAAGLFAFVLSWNEVFAAAVLTVRNPTLPAQVVGALASSPLQFRFAGGLALVLPAFVFIFFMRPYLFTAFRGVGAH